MSSILGTTGRESSDEQGPGAAIVLCGGRSLRMGTAKANLPWGDVPMLRHMVDVLASVCRPVIVAAAAHQSLPFLPEETIIARDDQPFEGPLSGLVAASMALPENAGWFVLTGCDSPLLSERVLVRLIELFENEASRCDAVLLDDGQQWHPLCGVYRRASISAARGVLQEGRRSLHAWTGRLTVRPVSVSSFSDLDPRGDFLRNINTWDEYQAAQSLQQPRS